MWYWVKILSLSLAGAIGLWLLYELVTFPSIASLKTENPTTTSMIEYRLSQERAAGEELRKFMIWTPIEQISPHLQNAMPVCQSQTRVSALPPQTCSISSIPFSPRKTLARGRV